MVLTSLDRFNYRQGPIKNTTSGPIVMAVIQNIILSAFSLYLGFFTFEPPLLGLLGKGDCLSRLWGLIAMPLMVPAAYGNGVTV